MECNPHLLLAALLSDPSHEFSACNIVRVMHPTKTARPDFLSRRLKSCPLSRSGCHLNIQLSVPHAFNLCVSIQVLNYHGDQSDEMQDEHPRIPQRTHPGNVAIACRAFSNLNQRTTRWLCRTSSLKTADGTVHKFS